MKKPVIAIIASAFLSIGAHSFAGGWQQATKITQFIIEGSAAGERIYVQFETESNPDACKGQGSEWNRIYGDTEKGKYLLSTILSAKATGQTVVPLIYGCDDWGRPRLSGLMVQ